MGRHINADNSPSNRPTLRSAKPGSSAVRPVLYTFPGTPAAVRCPIFRYRSQKPAGGTGADAGRISGLPLNASRGATASTGHATGEHQSSLVGGGRHRIVCWCRLSLLRPRQRFGQRREGFRRWRVGGPTGRGVARGRIAGPGPLCRCWPARIRQYAVRSRTF